MAHGNGMQQVLQVLGTINSRLDRLEVKVDALREDVNTRFDNLVFTMGGRVQSLDERLRKLETKSKRS
jgi:hypothetical protein